MNLDAQMTRITKFPGTHGHDDEEAEINAENFRQKNQKKVSNQNFAECLKRRARKNGESHISGIPKRQIEPLSSKI